MARTNYHETLNRIEPAIAAVDLTISIASIAVSIRSIVATLAIIAEKLEAIEISVRRDEP